MIVTTCYELDIDIPEYSVIDSYRQQISDNEFLTKND